MRDEQPTLRCIEGLRGDVQRLLGDAAEARLWWTYEARAKGAAAYFEQACEVLATHPAGHHEDRPKTIARALRAIRGVRRSVFQYQADFGSVLRSARHFWLEADELQDYELLALLALSEFHSVLNAVAQLLAKFDHSADDECIGRRDDLKEEAHRNELATWERDESDYAARNLARALEILMEARIAAACFDPATRAQIVSQTAVENGRKGRQIRTDKAAPVRAYALQKYEEGEWRSPRHAALSLYEDVLAYSRGQAFTLTESGAEQTVYRWFLKHEKAG